MYSLTDKNVTDTVKHKSTYSQRFRLIGDVVNHDSQKYSV